MSGLILKHITKSFGPLKVLDNISLELAEGELLVLLGPSGCGKSTLLRIIAGLESADEGEVHIGGIRADQLSPKDRQVAMVFQNYSLYPHMTVEKNLAFPLKVAHLKKPEIDRRIISVAEMLGLTDKLKNRPAELSGGQRQRVALGRAIIRKPSIFLLDEPLSNLDADLRARMRQEIVRVQRELKTTTVHVTHDQIEALTMANRIALLQDGRLIQTGTPEELYRNPDSIAAARAIGQPRINILDAAISDGFLSPFGFKIDRPIRSADGKLRIGVRPENIFVRAGGQFHGTVQSCEYLGEQYVGAIAFKETLLVVSGVSTALEPGRSVAFDINESAIILFDPVSGKRL